MLVNISYLIHYYISLRLFSAAFFKNLKKNFSSFCSQRQQMSVNAQWILGCGIDQNFELSIMLNVAFTHGWLRGANLQISVKINYYVHFAMFTINRENV